MCFFLACSEQDVVKSSVALSAFLLTECSDGDTESCSFQVFSVTKVFGNRPLAKLKERCLKKGNLPYSDYI